VLLDIPVQRYGDLAILQRIDAGAQDAQLVGWVERSDTHQPQFAKLMGFAKGSTHPAR